jgi:hypothetical protein
VVDPARASMKAAYFTSMRAWIDRGEAAEITSCGDPTGSTSTRSIATPPA